MVADEPPTLEIGKILLLLKEGLGGKPVGLVKLPHRFRHRRYLVSLARHGVLFFRHRPTNTIFVLFDYLGGADLKYRYPHPRELIVGGELGDVSWEEFERFSP